MNPQRFNLHAAAAKPDAPVVVDCAEGVLTIRHPADHIPGTPAGATIFLNGEPITAQQAAQLTEHPETPITPVDLV